MPLRTAANWGLSPCWPAVSTIDSGRWPSLDRQVQLAAQPAPRAPERVVGGLVVDSARFFALAVPPLRAPAAC